MAGRINFNVKARFAIVIENQVPAENIERIREFWNSVDCRNLSGSTKCISFFCASAIISVDDTLCSLQRLKGMTEKLNLNF